MASTTADDKSPAPAVTRAAAILTLLATERRPLGPTDIARTLELAKSSTLNLCIALEQAGLVRKSELGYSLGRKTVELGGAYVRGFDLITEFYRICAESTVLQQELLHIAMLDDTMVLYLARHEGRAPLRLSATVGDKFPATITAVGTILLAQLDPAFIRKKFSSPESMQSWTVKSVTTTDQLLAKLDATRDRGYAIDDGETNIGVYGLAVLLPPGRSGDAPLALGTSLMKASMSPDRQETVVKELFEARDSLASPNLIRP
jgi:DNA-binding IclR family transcriptional regulator